MSDKEFTNKMEERINNVNDCVSILYLVARTIKELSEEAPIEKVAV